jgi:hypothetical protein
VPALTIKDEHQAILALGLEVFAVLALGVVADQGGPWAVAAGVVLLALWMLFLMGNSGALRSKFGGVFG